MNAKGPKKQQRYAQGLLVIIVKPGPSADTELQAFVVGEDGLTRHMSVTETASLAIPALFSSMGANTKPILRTNRQVWPKRMLLCEHS